MKKLFLIAALLMLPLQTIAGAMNVSTFKGGGVGSVKFEVSTPYSFVKDLLKDDKAFTSLIPGIRSWKVLESSKGSQLAKTSIAFSKLVPPYNYVVRVTSVSDSELRFKRVSGDLKELEGSWKIAPGSKENTTLVTYTYRVDTGMKQVPNVLMERELRRHLEEIQANVKSKAKAIYAAQNKTSKDIQISKKDSKSSSSD
jgi:ribosome-associated toxin RatA of RatAB toxin-antitoxin module